MSLANLTTTGWLWFALTLCAWSHFLFDIALVLGRRREQVTAYPAVPALMTAWLMWLVS